jgi:hypothetical protein
MPVLTPIIDVIAQTGVVIAQVLVQAVRDSLPALVQLAVAVASLLPAMIPMVPLFGEWLAAVMPLLPTLIQLTAVVVTALVPVIRLFLTVLFRVYSTIIGLIIPVFRFVVQIIQWAAAIVTPIWNLIGAGIRGIGTVATWLWNIIKIAFGGIATAAKILYQIVAVVLLAPIIIAFKLIQAAAMFLWRNVIAPAFRGIASIIRAVYNATIKPVLNALVAVIRTVVAPVFRWIYNTVIKPVMDKVGAAIKWVWERVIRPVFNALKTAVGGLGSAFKTGVDAIRTAWDKLKDAAKKPVAFVVNTVFNKGIIGVWNAVAKLVPGVGELKPIRGFATGGIYPGYTPGRDVGYIGVSGGEAIMRPEWTRAVGPDFVHSANAAARSGGVGGVSRFMSGAFGGNFFLGGVVDGFKKAAKGFFAGGLKKAAQKVFGPLLDLTDRTLGRSGFGQLAAAIPRALIGKIMSFFGPLESKIGGDGRKVVTVAEKYLGLSGNPNKFTQRMGMNGAPWCGIFVDGVFNEAGASKALRAVSGTAAVRNYRSLPRVSRNAARPGDLPLYRGDDGHINIFTGKGSITIGGNESNSVRRQSGYINSASSIRRPAFASGGIVDLGHILDQDRRENRRGTTPPGTQLLRGMSGMKLFDSGGFLPTGPSLVYNGTGRPEPVFTEAQWDVLARSTAGGDGGDHFHLHMDEMTRAAYEQQMRSGFQAMQVQAARKDRTGRRR